MSLIIQKLACSNDFWRGDQHRGSGETNGIQPDSGTRGQLGRGRRQTNWKVASNWRSHFWSKLKGLFCSHLSITPITTSMEIVFSNLVLKLWSNYGNLIGNFNGNDTNWWIFHSMRNPMCSSFPWIFWSRLWDKW